MDSFKPLSPVTPKSPEELQRLKEEELDDAPTTTEKQERLEYLKSITPDHKQKPQKRRWPWVLLIVLLAAAAAGAYYYVSQPKTATVTKKTTTTTVKVTPAKPSTSSETTTYASNGTDLNLALDYPKTWTATPNSGNNKTDQTITLSSPLTSIPTADSKTITGKSVVTIRPASAGLSELSTGKAIAALDSLQIAYLKPTANQYQYPYLIFIGLTGSKTPDGAFDEILLSGSTHFPKGTSITQTSLVVDPIIAANFYNCTTPTCTGAGSSRVSIDQATWDNEVVFKQTLAIIQSLQLN